MNALSPDLTQQSTDLSSGVVSEIPDRKITKDTAKFFGVTVKHDDQGKELNHYYPYHDTSGIHIANKVRGRGKSFLWEGSSKAAALFGQQLFGANTAKAITVVAHRLCPPIPEAAAAEVRSAAVFWERLQETIGPREPEGKHPQ